MEAVRIDIDQLADYVQWKMDEEDLSLRAAAEKAKVSSATLSRILKKGRKRPRPDMETVAKIIRWLEVPMEKIFDTPVGRRVANKTGRSTLQEIQVHLRADKNLSSEAARAIADLVRVAYAQFAKQRRG